MKQAKKVEKEFAEAAALAAQPDTVTGYQYSPESGQFIGEYTFPNNKDKEEVHLPPNTTLEAPPVAEGHVAFFVDGSWELHPVETQVFRPKDEYELKIERPILTRVQVPDPENPGRAIDSLQWVSTPFSPETEEERALARKNEFHAQQRAWGLE